MPSAKAKSSDARCKRRLTFESRKVPGLYFIGEVHDVTGWLGGFNFQWAWASGHCAGLFVQAVTRLSIEVGSQPRTTPEGKAPADSKAQQPRQVVSISKGLQSACGGPSGLRRGYETTSNRIGGIYPLITVYPIFSLGFYLGEFISKNNRIIFTLI